MRVTVNAVPEEIEAGTTVLELVAAHTGRRLNDHGMPMTGGPLAMAVAVGGVVLRRADWGATALAEGDVVDLVTAVQGG